MAKREAEVEGLQNCFKVLRLAYKMSLLSAVGSLTSKAAFKSTKTEILYYSNLGEDELNLIQTRSQADLVFVYIFAITG